MMSHASSTSTLAGSNQPPGSSAGVLLCLHMLSLARLSNRIKLNSSESFSSETRKVYHAPVARARGFPLYPTERLNYAYTMGTHTAHRVYPHIHRHTQHLYCQHTTYHRAQSSSLSAPSLFTTIHNMRTHAATTAAAALWRETMFAKQLETPPEKCRQTRYYKCIISMRMEGSRDIPLSPPPHSARKRKRE